MYGPRFVACNALDLIRTFIIGKLAFLLYKIREKSARRGTHLES